MAESNPAKMESVLDIVGRMYNVDQARIEALKDVKPHHFICKDAPIQTTAHPSTDLIRRCRLTETANSVRRVDPITGEKINKLRKSYEGKIKELKIPGRNKAIERPGEWWPNLMGIPEQDWQDMNNSKMPVHKMKDTDFMARINKAISFVPGTLPPKEASKYKTIIGLDDAVPAKSIRPGMVAPGGRPHVQHANSSPASSANKLARPERTGSKRRYMDSSFEGYGDGFDPEDNTDGDMRLNKKPRKDFPSVGTPRTVARV